MKSTSAAHGKENIDAALENTNSFPSNILETNEDVHISAHLFMFTPYQSGITQWLSTDELRNGALLWNALPNNKGKE